MTNCSIWATKGISKKDMPADKSEVSALAVAEILHGVQNSKTGYLTLTMPLLGKIFLWQGGACIGKSMYQIRSF